MRIKENPESKRTNSEEKKSSCLRSQQLNKYFPVLNVTENKKFLFAFVVVVLNWDY